MTLETLFLLAWAYLLVITARMLWIVHEAVAYAFVALLQRLSRWLDRPSRVPQRRKGARVTRKERRDMGIR